MIWLESGEFCKNSQFGPGTRVKSPCPVYHQVPSLSQGLTLTDRYSGGIFVLTLEGKKKRKFKVVRKK